MRPLFFILPKISEYVKTLKDKDGDKGKNKNSKLMSFRIGNIWTKIEDLQYIALNPLPVYDIKYMKTIIRKYGDKVYTTFRGFARR